MVFFKYTTSQYLMGGLSDFPTVRKKTTDSPGPGKYDVPSSFGPNSGGKHVSILGARSPRTVSDAHLGPGTYSHKSMLGGPSHSIAAPIPPGYTVCQSGTLGPKYDVNHHTMSSNPSSPRFSMGVRTATSSALSPRNKADHNMPGPGSYNFEPDTDAVSKFKHSTVKIAPPPKPREFGDSGRELGPRTQAYYNPGPGSYALGRFGDNTPKSSGVPPPKRKGGPDPTPGPGAYDVDQHTILSGGNTPRSKIVMTTTFGGKGHPLEGQSCSPGPGQYALPNSWTKGGVSISNKPESYGDLDSVNPKPGPGEYHLPSIAFPPGTTRGYTISPRYESAKVLATPGPGAYEEKGRDMFDAAERLKKLAAATNTGPISPRSAKSALQQGQANTPGPGSYRIPGAINTAKGTSMGPKGDAMCKRSHWLDDKAHAPGPGTYNQKYDSTVHDEGITFHKGQFLPPRPPLETPGPGAYDHDKAFATSHSSRATQFQTTTHLT